MRLTVAKLPVGFHNYVEALNPFVVTRKLRFLMRNEDYHDLSKLQL